MGGGFRPFRREIDYVKSRSAPVGPLLDTPGFALAGKGWGAKLRYGLVAIDEASMDAIAEAMCAADALNSKSKTAVGA